MTDKVGVVVAERRSVFDLGGGSNVSRRFRSSAATHWNAKILMRGEGVSMPSLMPEISAVRKRRHGRR